MKLTEEQKKIVEENHNLIYSFCHTKKINIEEYYGDLAISLCKAVVKYNNNKSKMSTYLYNNFNRIVSRQNRDNNYQCRMANKFVVDLYKPEINIIDFKNSAMKEFNLRTIESVLKTDEVGKLLLKGCKQKEICEKLNISQPKVSRIIKKLKRKIYDEIII